MEQETIKLLNVLRRIARAAGYAEWLKAEPEATRFCAGQYNRVLARLSELEPAAKSLFAPLAEDVSPEVVRLAAREVLAYFEPDAPEVGWSFEQKLHTGCRPRRTRSRCVPVSVFVGKSPTAA